jgi:hypothetical protein
MTWIPNDYVSHMGDNGWVQCGLCGPCYTEGGPFYLTKGLELCWLHLDSIVTQEVIPKVSKHGLEHLKVL